jgi:hypothetical protein
MQASVTGDSVSRAQSNEADLLRLEFGFAALIVKPNEGQQLGSEEKYQLMKLYRSRWSGHLLEYIRSKTLKLLSRVAARNMAR